MNCPNCGGTSYVIDSRPSDKYGPSVRRRLMCWKCRSRFTTYEMLATQAENYSRAKELLKKINNYVKENGEVQK